MSTIWSATQAHAVECDIVGQLQVETRYELDGPAARIGSGFDAKDLHPLCRFRRSKIDGAVRQFFKSGLAPVQKFAIIYLGDPHGLAQAGECPLPLPLSRGIAALQNQIESQRLAVSHSRGCKLQHYLATNFANVRTEDPKGVCCGLFCCASELLCDRLTYERCSAVVRAEHIANYAPASGGVQPNAGALNELEATGLVIIGDNALRRQDWRAIEKIRGVAVMIYGKGVAPNALS